MNTSRPRIGGFTLIEVLIVIGIIAILAGLLLGTSGFVQEKAGRARAQGEIETISAALENFKSDYGYYPIATDAKDGTRKIIEVLMPSETNKFPKIYMSFPKKMLEKPDNPESGRLVDPFGNPYFYYYNPGKAENPETGTTNNVPASFDLWSIGRKKGGKQPEKETWIKNW
jgi:prepilin-type N-terminal cleavage/methylation domain-containing protein